MKQELELADICPNWMAALKTHKSTIKLGSDRQKYCMVGEAWGFSNYYTRKCGECNRFSLELAWCVKGTSWYKNEKESRFEVIVLNEFKQLSSEFVKHFNKAHKEEWFQRQSA